MKTIHIRKQFSRSKNEKLIRLLYKKYLIHDDLFHFFYEPELIIRIKFESIQKQIENYLKENKIPYEVYDFPKPINTKGNYCFECIPFVLKNLSYFYEIYHSHSVLFFKLNKKDYASYADKIYHTALNIGNYSYYEEAEKSIMRGLFYHELVFKII